MLLLQDKLRSQYVNSNNNNNHNNNNNNKFISDVQYSTCVDYCTLHLGLCTVYNTILFPYQIIIFKRGEGKTLIYFPYQMFIMVVLVPLSTRIISL